MSTTKRGRRPSKREVAPAKPKPNTTAVEVAEEEVEKVTPIAEAPVEEIEVQEPEEVEVQEDTKSTYRETPSGKSLYIHDKFKRKKERTFVLTTGNYPLTYMMKTGADGKLLDPYSPYPRPIRHCPNEKSIYIDEQSDFAVIEPIIFEKGYLTLGPEKMYTQEFLFRSPQYDKYFTYNDPQEEAEKRMKMDDLKVELKYELMKTAKLKNGRFELLPIAASIRNSVAAVESMATAELRNIIREEIDANPYRFTTEDGEISLFSHDVKRKFIALKAVDSGVLTLDEMGTQYFWTKTRKTVLNVPNGIKPIDHLVQYLGTDDGILLAGELAKQV